MKLKKRLIRYCSITTLSLGLLFSPLTITPKTNSFVIYDDSEPRWEYSTHGWYFTREEIEKIYEKEYRNGERLENYIKIEEGKYVASYKGKSFEIPEKFVKTTLKQLEDMLKEGYAEYIFRLDACHSHLFVPNKIFEKYNGLFGVELIQEYTKDDQVGALYHNAEHLALRNPPKTGEIDPIAKELISKRSVLGWYDGRPLELTYPKNDDPQKLKEANSASIPDDYHLIGNLVFKATKNGEFSINHDGKEIRVDISFDAFSYY